MDSREKQGDRVLTRQLRDAARRDALGTAIILSGGGDLPAAGRLLAAAMECTGEGGAPCGRCEGCRKVLADIHPDVITVRDGEHKNIALSVVRAVCADAYVLPNEGKRKIYLFPECALLDVKAQNVLLKVVEDAPARSTFIFCAENPAQLLPTIRSRCTCWMLGEVEEGGQPGEQARQLCRLLAGRRREALAVFFTGLEQSRIPREELQLLLEEARGILKRALLAGRGCQGQGEEELCALLGRSLSPAQLSRAADLLQTYVLQLRFNLNVGHAAGALGVALWDVIR